MNLSVVITGYFYGSLEWFILRSSTTPLSIYFKGFEESYEAKGKSSFAK